MFLDIFILENHIKPTEKEIIDEGRL